ncbi:MAG: hypothetical protein ABFC12_06570 [Methanobacterium sp.]
MEFIDESFDLIWAEGSLFEIGFEEALRGLATLNQGPWFHGASYTLPGPSGKDKIN